MLGVKRESMGGKSVLRWRVLCFDELTRRMELRCQSRSHNVHKDANQSTSLLPVSKSSCSHDHENLRSVVS